MALKGYLKKYENIIGTIACLLIIMIFTAVRYDYYFDLNDDVLMKDILAGVYTGVPEGHNIQMLWLISALISLFYRAGRSLPWYGLFLCFCHYGSLGLIIHRSLSFCQKLSGKALLLLTETVLIISLFLDHLVAAQYTVTCTLLAGAAAFLFFTADSNLPAKQFIRKNAGAVLLVALAYLIRSEMLLLVLPLICVAGVVKWGSEEKIFTKENAVKYLTVIGGILAGLAIGQVSHMIAYGSEQWRTFTEYFNNRTELYDFQEIPDYKEHQRFYEQIGLTESEKQLLDNYNFGLDEEIDEKLLGEIAEYAAANRSANKPFMQNLKESAGEYYRRTVYPPSHNESDFPWNWVIMISYLAVFLTALLIKGKKLRVRFLQILWKLAFLGSVRTVLWMWLIMRDRVPERISHSMYLMELCILLAMLFVQCGKLKEESQRTGRINPAPLLAGAVYGVLALLSLPSSVSAADADAAGKAQANVRYEQLYAYLGNEENKNNFYFIDVYSSVAYTEKMFVNVDNSLDNYDIMGGWACKSPLWRKKLSAFGIDNMETALVEREDVFYVQETGADTDWLYQYYADHGVNIVMELVSEANGEFEIYRIEEWEG